MGKGRTVLIDADIVLFRSAYRNEVEYEWGDGVASAVVDFKKAKKDVLTEFKRIQTATGATDYLACFTESPNFRYEVYPDYKSNRRDVDKPELIAPLREDAVKYLKTKMFPTLEADDVMGILATKYPDDFIIATIDKDLKQIPAKHYNWDKKLLFEITEEEGKYFFYKQVLMGDTVDGYSGCPYIGTKRADKLLEDCVTDEDYWKVIVKAYKDKKLDEDYALQMARVARILQVDDWDGKANKVKLWTPTK